MDPKSIKLMVKAREAFEKAFHQTHTAAQLANLLDDQLIPMVLEWRESLNSTVDLVQDSPPKQTLDKLKQHVITTPPPPPETAEVGSLHQPQEVIPVPQPQPTRNQNLKRKDVPTHSKTITVDQEGKLPKDKFEWEKPTRWRVAKTKLLRRGYKCKEKGCSATKHITSSDKNQVTFEVTYIGLHTCHRYRGYGLGKDDIVEVPTDDGNQAGLNSNQLSLRNDSSADIGASYMGGVPIDGGNRVSNQLHSDGAMIGQNSMGVEGAQGGSELWNLGGEMASFQVGQGGGDQQWPPLDDQIALGENWLEMIKFRQPWNLDGYMANFEVGQGGGDQQWPPVDDQLVLGENWLETIDFKDPEVGQGSGDQDGAQIDQIEDN